MRRVLIPLDGSGFAETIVTDARRLAGPDGEIVLVREASVPIWQRDVFVDTSMLAVENSEQYLEHEAETLRAEGASVRTQSLILASAAQAIAEAVKIFDIDMIAIATHGRKPLGRLIHGSTAWRALTHSPVPVLLRHVESGIPPDGSVGNKRRIMVPLDGSTYAERALPLAQELALEWDAQLWLVQVALNVPNMNFPYTRITPLTDIEEREVKDAHAYLQGVAESLHGEVHIRAEHGPIMETLIRDIDHYAITDVVMTSHGRTGLSRAMLGSVADDLLLRLHLPIIIIPVHAAGQTKGHGAVDRPGTANGVASVKDGAS